jgi:polar amino acid transport system substrate-binding protein
MRNRGEKIMLHRLLLLLICCTSPLTLAMAPVRLATHELPPYSFTSNTGLQEGIAVKRVKCAFDRIKVPVVVEFLPWARAQLHAREGLADGFFAASQSAERESWAVMSAIIAPQQWHWYLLKDSALDPKSSSFKQQASVTSFVGANMLSWLSENGYRVEANPFTNQQLLDMLLSKRLDAILANRLVMESLLAEHRAIGKIRSVLEQDKPLGIYFGKVFLAKAGTDFLPRLNRAIQDCGR